jgi:S-layer homology domain.
MKNLKKILSLSLAVVMLLGVMIFPASAAEGKMTYADLVDKDDITNINEVALLVDLGIIEGKPGSVYDPTGIVDRATMAKLVTTLLLNNADAAQFLGTTSDLTDIGGNWAEGFILYCYTQNVIAGDGMGNFFPTNQVTVAEAAKMLLVTLGYDANKAGLVGTDWAVNTISLASSVGVLSGVNLRSTDKLDRDNLALMMYNTLFANQVAYNTLFGNEPISKNNTLGLATYGLVKVTGLVQRADERSVYFINNEVTPDDGSTNGLSIPTFRLGNQHAFIGKYATGYVKVRTNTVPAGNGWNLAATVVPTANVLEVYSSALVEADVNVFVSVNGTNLFNLFHGRNAVAKIEAAYTGTAITGLETEFFYNDVLVSGVTTALLTAGLVEDHYKSAPDKIELTNATDRFIANAVARKGVIVQVSDLNNDGYAEVVYITEYTAAQVTNVSSTSVSFSTKFAGYASSPAIDKNRWDKVDIVGADDLKVDDYAYGYVNTEGKLVLMAAEQTDAKITSITVDKNFTADGTRYEFAGYTTPEGMSDADIRVNFEVSIFTDSNGYVLAVDKIKGTAKYAFVVASDNFDVSSTASVNIYPLARLLLTDGTTVRVEMDRSSFGSGIATDADIVGEIVEYTINTDGTYDIDLASPAKPIASGIEIKTNSAMIGTGSASIPVDNATVFVDGTGKTTYTGIKNIPNFTVNGTKTAAAFMNRDGVAEYVFISDNDSALGVDGLFVVINADISQYDKFFTMNVITADGVVAKSFENKFRPVSGANALVLGNAYIANGVKTIDGAEVYSSLTTTGTNVYTGSTLGDFEIKRGNVTALGNGIIKVGANDSVLYSASVPEVGVDTTNSKLKATLDGIEFSSNSSSDYTTEVIVISAKPATTGASREATIVICVAKGDDVTRFTSTGSLTAAAVTAGTPVTVTNTIAVTKDGVPATGATPAYSIAIKAGETAIAADVTIASTGVITAAQTGGFTATPTSAVYVISATYTVDGLTYVVTAEVSVTAFSA